MKLLLVDSSILGNTSASRRMTKAIVDRLRAESPALEVTYRNLTAEPLPHLTRPILPVEHPLSAAQDANANDVHAQHVSARVLEEFLAAEFVVIGAPMYNFSLPSQLKVWIDRVLVPRRTFAYGRMA